MKYNRTREIVASIVAVAGMGITFFIYFTIIFNGIRISTIAFLWKASIAAIGTGAVAGVITRDRWKEPLLAGLSPSIMMVGMLLVGLLGPTEQQKWNLLKGCAPIFLVNITLAFCFAVTLLAAPRLLSRQQVRKKTHPTKAQLPS